MNKIEIKSSDGLLIHGDFFKNSSEKLPLVIFVHGFKGFKDWGGFPHLMQNLAESDFAAFSFNFTYNGVTDEDPVNFTRLDLFAQNTYSRELVELGCVIDHFFDNAGNYRIDKQKIALVGHSRGGGIAVLKTAVDKRIKCLVLLSSVSTFDRYSGKMKEQWRKTGYIESENTRTKQMMRLNLSLLDEIEVNDLDVLSSMKKITVPLLIIHGKEDLAVRYSEAEALWENSQKKNSEMLLIEKTGHTFGIVHPFAGTTEAFEKVISETTDFLNKKFR